MKEGLWNDNFGLSLSVVVPTHNNLEVLRQCLESWERYASRKVVEIIVLEDGCSDGTASYLESLASSEWGHQHLSWHHLDDQHELRCTNVGFQHAQAPLVMAWQDDMFLRSGWLVPEIVATFAKYAELGLLSLARGVNCFPVEEPIRRWEDLIDWRRLKSTIGPRPLNWFRLQEVDAIIRPWVVRRVCLDRVGLLDEAFVPTEWDETDLSFRVRAAGWKVATHGYERDRAYVHLGSTTTGVLSASYKQRVLKNGQLFHERWGEMLQTGAQRHRKTWLRRSTPQGLLATLSRASRALLSVCLGHSE